MRPTGMIFAAQAGTFSPSSQTVRLSTAAPGQIEARSGLFTVNGGNRLEILPPNVVLSAEDPRSVVVQPHIEDLATGVYRGQLAYSFSDGSPSQRVDILFLVVPTPVSATVSGLHNQVEEERPLTLDAGGGLRTATPPCGHSDALEWLLAPGGLSCGRSIAGSGQLWKSGEECHGGGELLQWR